MIANAELAGRHVGVTRELLGEDLAGLDLGSFFARPDNALAGLLEVIDDPASQWVFRPNDRQLDVFLFDEAEQPVEVIYVHRDVDALLFHAGVARSAVDLLDARRLRQFPDEGVLAAAF